MSVARKTPKFADSSREEKWEKPSKKKSGSRISDYDFQDKENIDSSSNIPTSYSDRNWDQSSEFTANSDVDSTKRSTKRSSRDSKDEKKKKTKSKKEEIEIREIEEEDEEEYDIIKTSLPRSKNSQRESKEFEPEYSDFQETKKALNRKGSRLKLGGDSMDLSEIASTYFNNQDFDKHIERLKNLGRNEDDGELDPSDLKDSTRKLKESKKSKSQLLESPSSSKFSDSLKKELKSNLEKVRSMKKERGSIDGLSEFSEGSVMSRRLSTSRQTPTNKRTDQSFEKINKLKRENSKSKIEVQGKIDFINSMFEELSLNPKDDLKAITKPKKSKIIEDVEEISRPPKEYTDRVSSTRNQKQTRKPLRDMNEDPEEDNSSPEPVPQKKIPESRLQSKKKPKAREPEPEPEEEEEVKPKSKRTTRKSERLEEQEERGSDSKRVLSRKGSLSRISELDLPSGSLETPSNTKLENKVAKKGKPPAPSSARKELSKPPLPIKKDDDEEEEVGFVEPIPSVSDKHPLGLSSAEKRNASKNFLEMNKNMVDATKKLHKSYEKVLLNFDQSIKPMLNSLQKKAQMSPARQRLMSPGRSLKSPSPSNRSSTKGILNSSPFRDSSNYDFGFPGFMGCPVSMQQFYQEMSNLTQRITEAATMMQKTLEQIESFRRSEESRYSAKGGTNRTYSSNREHHIEKEHIHKKGPYRKDEEDEDEEEEEENQEEEEQDQSDYSDS